MNTLFLDSDILREVIQRANNYGKMELDFNIKLLKIKGKVATVQCWNDGDERKDRYKATVRLLPQSGVRLLEVKHGDEESQIVGASGRALCAILYV